MGFGDGPGLETPSISRRKVVVQASGTVLCTTKRLALIFSRAWAVAREFVDRRLRL